MTEQQPHTVTVEEAAAVMATTPDAIRKRIARGTLAASKGPGGRWQVLLPAELPPGAAPPPPGGASPAASLAARLATLEAENTAMLQQLAEMTAERDAWRQQAHGTLQALQQQQALSLPDRMRDLPALEGRAGPLGRLWEALTRRR